MNDSQLGFSMDGSQYLTFTLGPEEYGVDVLKVQEIKGYSAITPIPNTPRYLRGVMNLRGVIVPVIDLRLKFDIPEIEHGNFTVIIVVVLAGRVTGLIVDTVSDVLTIRKDDIQPTPGISGKVDTSFLCGMAQVSGRLVILLDLDKVLVSELRAPTDSGVSITA